jgi:transcription initiation factor TFIIH subunit 4
MPAVEELPAKDAVPHPLLRFLQSQPRKALSRLYQRPSSCLCIFRFLPYSHLVKVESANAWDLAICALRLLGPLERQIVMNILWLDASIPAPTISSWIVREGKKSVFWIVPWESPHSSKPIR